MVYNLCGYVLYSWKSLLKCEACLKNPTNWIQTLIAKLLRACSYFPKRTPRKLKVMYPCQCFHF
jgi:hypothetical protein